MLSLKTIFNYSTHLFYPHNCTGCGSDLLTAGNLLCAKCIIDLPQTNFAEYANNPVEKIFWGRVPIAAAHSEFYFAKEALVQQLIHQLKYNNNKEIGIYLGEIMGGSLKKSKRFKNIDALVPLPLYPDKERKRGYNQAAIICQGMSTVMEIPVLYNNLLRVRYTDTQTKKHRAERWENVEGSFAIKNSEALKDKHVLLVDDVVTTGATIEAGTNALLQASVASISIATLTIATK